MTCSRFWGTLLSMYSCYSENQINKTENYDTVIYVTYHAFIKDYRYSFFRDSLKDFMFFQKGCMLCLFGQTKKTLNLDILNLTRNFNKYFLNTALS